jgi:acyl dehydratase
MTDDAIWRLAAVSGDDMADWCRALNDENPIHLDRAAAEANGFGPRRVNPGPANLAFVMNALLQTDPDADIAEVEAVFLGNVFEDDALTVSAAPRNGDTPPTRSLDLSRSGDDGDPDQVVLRAQIRLRGDVEQDDT